MKHEKNKVLLFFHVKAGLSDTAYVACGGKILYIPACHKIRHTRQGLSLQRPGDSCHEDSLERAVLSKRGIKLYTKGSESPSMFIPFFRMGVISPAGVDEFYRLLKAKDIHIEKQFVTLPGHGRSKKIIPALYSALALLTLASLTQAVALASAIVKQS